MGDTTGNEEPGDLVERLRKLEAECERHRRANLVRSVIQGWDEALDGSLTDYINEAGWDAVPWRIAQTHIERSSGVGHG